MDVEAKTSVGGTGETCPGDGFSGATGDELPLGAPLLPPERLLNDTLEIYSRYFKMGLALSKTLLRVPQMGNRKPISIIALLKCQVYLFIQNLIYDIVKEQYIVFFMIVCTSITQKLHIMYAKIILQFYLSIPSFNSYNGQIPVCIFLWSRQQLFK